jgi:hypothetical protein
MMVALVLRSISIAMTGTATIPFSPAAQTAGERRSCCE